MRVQGRSMVPTLSPGQQVLVNPTAYRDRHPQTGDVVVARHPHQTDLVVIKRVGRVDSSALQLLGDNPQQTTDSRDYGPVPIDCLLGQVVCTLTTGQP